MAIHQEACKEQGVGRKLLEVLPHELRRENAWDSTSTVSCLIKFANHVFRTSPNIGLYLYRELSWTSAQKLITVVLGFLDLSLDLER